jgi:aminocarboxymuconate-semialdehyde decarboxylase
MTHDHSKCGLIDVHCHVVPLDLPVDPTGGKLALWPQMTCCADGHTAMFVAGPTTRKFDGRTWLASRRIDYMDQHGIDMQTLSPVPELFAYWFEPSATAIMCRYVNDAMAKMVDENPTRFAALGGLPMNDPEMAIAEARRLKKLGFAGVEIGSNINGISPADARYADVLATLHELDLAVFVHGVRPATEGRLVGPQVLAAIVGIPGDTSLCVASFISARVLDTLPNLRVGFSHGGGGIGAVIDRFEHIWSVMPELKEAIPTSPLLEARKFYYDIMTFDTDYTLHLMNKFGSQALFVGTDFPAAGMGLMDPVGYIDKMNLTGDDLENVRHRNARRFLGMKAQ